jgi:hypothetical protein
MIQLKTHDLISIINVIILCINLKTRRGKFLQAEEGLYMKRFAKNLFLLRSLQVGKNTKRFFETQLLLLPSVSVIIFQKNLSHIQYRFRSVFYHFKS